MKFIYSAPIRFVMMLIVVYSCSSIPQKAVSVSNFKSNNYLGTWYEIARLDFKYERNLTNVTANYSMNKDGSIQVINRGYHSINKEWKQAKGKAKFRGDQTVANLKVSFFGPFYAGYNVIAVDENYQYALIAGKNLDYLWILSRTTIVPENIKKSYLKLANDIGYDTSKLIWVNHQ